MTLVFVSMFLVIFVALTGLVSRTYQESVHQAQEATAFGIAEAGLNYGRWRLAHDIDNYEAATKDMEDPLFAGTLGSFDITFQEPPPGTTTIVIESTGYVTGSQDRAVTLRARYGRPSLARFAEVFNEDVWKAGTIQGQIHANGGIRMDLDEDATSDFLVTSAKETYACQPLHGCSAPFETKSGVWGTGQLQELWKYPVSLIDYASITLDLLKIKTAAEDTGNYYGPSGADEYGYQLEFNNNHTYSISVVTSKGPEVWSWWEGSYEKLSHDVEATELLVTKLVPPGGVIYVEDTLWLKGNILDRVTVAAGKFPDTPATNVDIILNGNISYGGVKDGTRVLAAIAQRHILIPWSGAPNDLALDGAFVAQKGSFHRRFYPNGFGSEDHSLKTRLSVYGMIASNGVPATSWVDGGGNVTSGYPSGSSEYDANMLYGPPPYFPSSDEYEFISWEEVQ